MQSQRAALDEAALSRWLSQRIDDGELEIQDTPQLLARYALADPGALRNEFDSFARALVARALPAAS